MENATAYDLVSYPGWPYPQTHPDRLATLATLFGMTPADPAECRVLELGCGDGANLIPIAYAAPRIRAVGIDLASSAIQRGRLVATQLGLANIDLLTGDVADLPDDLGEFDYIIAHGVYSWVPEAVRKALLDACRRFLAPNGVTFLSYNVYPGGHLRRMLRDALLMHIEGIEEPGRRNAAAREFLAWIRSASGGSGSDVPTALAREAQRLDKRADGSLFHDDLSEEFHLCYFRDFCDEAHGHGLQFLAETDFFEMQDRALPLAARQQLAAFAPGLIEREQYLDFLKERRFRQTLLCRSEVPLRTAVDGDAVWGLAISSAAQVEGDRSDSMSGKEQRYAAPRGATFSTNTPLLKVALDLVRAEWPRARPLEALLAAAAARCGLSATAAERSLLADFALGCYAAGSVDLHVRQPAFARHPGRHPRASALATLQARSGKTVTGLIGNMIGLDDPLAHWLLDLLDGTRDRAALLHAIRGDAAAMVALNVATGGRTDAAAGSEALERCLEGLGRCALLSSDTE